MHVYFIIQEMETQIFVTQTGTYSYEIIENEIQNFSWIDSVYLYEGKHVTFPLFLFFCFRVLEPGLFAF